MKERLKMKHFFNGIWLGTSLLAPGLSFATVAMVLGIYEQLLDLVNDFFSSRWKQTIQTLIPLGIGAVVAVFVSSKLISLALDHYSIPTYFLFLGFVVGAIPLLLKTVAAKTTFKKRHLILLVIVASLIASLAWINEPEVSHYVQQLDIITALRLLVTGALTTTAMLIPGVSAALVLLLLGTYTMLNHALSTLNLPVLGILVVGGLIGLILSSKGIKFLLKNYLDFTYAASIGMIIGSTVVIYPGLSFNVIEIIASFMTFTVGYLAVIFLERKKAQNPEENEKSLLSVE